MKTETFLENLRTKVYCRLGVSPIHGIGVFSIRWIPEGINPMEEKREQAYDRIKADDMKAALTSASIEIIDLVTAMCVEVKEKTGTWWYCPSQGLNSIGIAWYLNHSKTPNLEERNGHFFALTDIPAGDELTVDYSSYGELNL